MSIRAIFSTVIILAILGAIAYGLSSVQAGAQATDQRTVRWLLSHQPTDVFERAAAVFKEQLEKESGGSLTLTVVTPQDIGIEKGDVPNARVFEMLESGESDMATAYTVALGYEVPDMWAVNLPFLFENHADVSQTLDGDVGVAILDMLPQKYGVVGLAFTMSGGYRIIASKNTQIDSLDDLRGKRIATSGGPVAEATLRALGAEPVRTDLEAGTVSLDASTIDGVEITYSRLGQVIGNTEYTKYVNETNHSVFLTAILASTSFYDSLSAQEQLALRKAAVAAAQVEREDSLKLGESVRAQLIDSGSTVTRLTAESASAFYAATRAVYDSFAPQFTPSVAEALGL